MDATLMERWIREIWLKYTQRKKALLVMDSFKAHCTDEIQELLAKSNCAVAFIPGGCTSKLQPLDVSLNKPFKAVCRNSFSSFCRSQLANMTDPADRLKTATKQQVCQWVEKAHEDLSTKKDMVIKSFQVTGISLALDGSENNLFRNDKLLKQALEAAQGEDDDEPEDAEEDACLLYTSPSPRDATLSRMPSSA